MDTVLKAHNGGPRVDFHTFLSVQSKLNHFTATRQEYVDMWLRVSIALSFFKTNQF